MSKSRFSRKLNQPRTTTQRTDAMSMRDKTIDAQVRQHPARFLKQNYATKTRESP